MPVATVNPEDIAHYDLKSLAGGYVEIRRMSYGAWLKRQEMAMQMKIHGTDKRNTETELTSMQRAVTQYELAQCIVNHNLTDANEHPLDFRAPHTIDVLHPKVGNELAGYIADLHEFEDDLGNLLTESTS